MSEDVIGFDSYSARRIDDTVTRVLGSESSPATHPQPYGGRQAIVVKPVEPLLEITWPTSPFDAAIQTIDGDVWTPGDNVAEPVRTITNGLQLAFPVAGAGLCVQDIGFWAVNIGALTAATNFLTGHVVGNAALLTTNAAGNLVVSTGRVKFINRDTGMALDDGTPIILGYVSGNLTILWAACDADPDLEDIPLDPEA